jgi:hypothetical protein
MTQGLTSLPVDVWWRILEDVVQQSAPLAGAHRYYVSVQRPAWVRVWRRLGRRSSGGGSAKRHLLATSPLTAATSSRVV